LVIVFSNNLKPKKTFEISKISAYRFNEMGKVVSVDQSRIRYPVVVRFDKVNYAGVSTNNYSLDEIEEVYNVIVIY